MSVRMLVYPGHLSIEPSTAGPVTETASNVISTPLFCQPWTRAQPNKRSGLPATLGRKVRRVDLSCLHTAMIWLAWALAQKPRPMVKTSSTAKLAQRTLHFAGQEVRLRLTSSH